MVGPTHQLTEWAMPPIGLNFHLSPSRQFLKKPPPVKLHDILGEKFQIILSNLHFKIGNSLGLLKKNGNSPLLSKRSSHFFALWPALF